jgi:hypothetical protein
MYIKHSSANKNVSLTDFKKLKLKEAPLGVAAGVSEKTTFWCLSCTVVKSAQSAGRGRVRHSPNPRCLPWLEES